MRKLGRRNYLLFGILFLVSLSIVGLFLFGIYQVLSFDRTEYHLSPGTLLYNEQNQFIALTEEGTLREKWDHNYYLETKEEGKKVTYFIGKDTVAYLKSDYRLYAYGPLYQIHQNGSVSITKNQTEIARNSAPMFFKIRDRKYLFVDQTITIKNQEFTAHDYLIIELDKAGNAFLFNNEVNMKTIHPLELVGTAFSFHIAKEQLLFGDQIIDTKKIIGSTNEYEEPSVKPPSTKPESPTQKPGSSEIPNPGTVIVGGSDSTKKEHVSWVGLSAIQPGVTYVDLSYLVNDPDQLYHSVFVRLLDQKKEAILLNKETTHYRLTDLKPDHTYTLQFGYTYVDETSKQVIEKIEDVSVFKTRKPTNQIKVTKVTKDKIFYQLSLDPNYQLEEAQIVLYSDGQEQNRKEVPIEEAMKPGYLGFFDVTQLGYEVEIRLEHCIYNGTMIDEVIKDKYINE